MTTGAAQSNPNPLSNADAVRSSGKAILHDKETHQALVAMQTRVCKKQPEPILADMRIQLGQQLETILSMTMEVMDELAVLIQSDNGFSRENIYLLAHTRAIVHTISQFLYPVEDKG